MALEKTYIFLYIVLSGMRQSYSSNKRDQTRVCVSTEMQLTRNVLNKIFIVLNNKYKSSRKGAKYKTMTAM